MSWLRKLLFSNQKIVWLGHPNVCPIANEGKKYKSYKRSTNLTSEVQTLQTQLQRFESLNVEIISWNY